MSDDTWTAGGGASVDAAPAGAGAGDWGPTSGAGGEAPEMSALFSHFAEEGLGRLGEPGGFEPPTPLGDFGKPADWIEGYQNEGRIARSYAKERPLYDVHGTVGEPSSGSIGPGSYEPRSQATFDALGRITAEAPRAGRPSAADLESGRRLGW